jgi:D-beta-D-heptose 7-phosphate kinase/D-beta-D-heptose 1-phosphate adenosyltransferase
MITSTFDILKAMEGKRILVLGDVMLDRFVYGRTERVSPEAPTLILAADRQEQMLGGAANVALNIANLGGRCHLIGLCGVDTVAQELTRELACVAGIEADLVEDPSRTTTHKIRMVNPQHNTHLLRLDWETTNPAQGPILAELRRRAVRAVALVDVVIISDYLKGTLQPSLIEAVIQAAANYRVPVVVDPKGRDFSRYSGATVITPNLHELSLSLGHSIAQNDRAVELAATELSAISAVPAVVVKRSQDGIQVVEAGQTTARFHTLARRVVDVSGAGDTLVAAFGMALAAGADIQNAARIGNAAAGIVVAQKGTSFATSDEIAALLLNRHQHMISPKIFSSMAALRQQVGAWQDEGLSVGFTNGCFDLLHPGHISSLTESRNRVDRLVLALNTDASVRQFKGLGRPVQSETARITVAAALEAVDAVILFDTETPLDLIVALKPNILFKGADYEMETVVGRTEVEAYGGRVELVPYLPNTSTTQMIERISMIEPCGASGFVAKHQNV